MAKEKTTRRQKDISRLLREKKKFRRDKIKRVKRNSKRPPEEQKGS